MQKTAVSFSRVYWGAVLAISGALTLYFTLNSRRLTAFLTVDEHTEFYIDNLPVKLLMMAAWVVCLWGLTRFMRGLVWI